MRELENEILGIIVSVTKVDREKLIYEAIFTDLGIESLDIIEIVFQLEEKYDIAIPFNANDGGREIVGTPATNVGSMLEMVTNLIEEKRKEIAEASLAPVKIMVTSGGFDPESNL